jgi:hypothetical protein
MKDKLFNIVIIISFTGLFMSCVTTSQFTPGSGNKYQYTYKLVSPIKNSSLLFRDDSVIIQFKFDEAAIRFQLQNISKSNITLDWNRASIGISDRYFAVRHASNFYGDTLFSNSIIMPPFGYLRDVVIPRNNVYNDGAKWVELDLLPTTDHRSLQVQESIKKNVGKQVSLIFPILFGSTTINYKFNFQVDTVKRIAWKDYTPLKRVPAPPRPEHAGTALDNVTTAVITVGILGFFAYVLSIKKNPPTE